MVVTIYHALRKLMAVFILTVMLLLAFTWMWIVLFGSTNGEDDTEYSRVLADFELLLSFENFPRVFLKLYDGMTSCVSLPHPSSIRILICVDCLYRASGVISVVFDLFGILVLVVSAARAWWYDGVFQRPFPGTTQ